MSRRILVVLALLAATVAAEAQHHFPQGRWWRRAPLAAKLDLTREQQQKLDGLFQSAADNLIDAKAEVRKLQLALRSELERPEVRREEVRRIGGQLNAARGRLFDRELMMLVDMRGVLDEQQWVQLQDEPDVRPPDTPRAPRPPRPPHAPRRQR